jgi:cytochrome c oxidase subunit 2
MRLAALAAFLLTIMSGAAFADGIPTEWQVGFQEAASPSMERITDFHNMLLWVITLISVFVLILLVIVVVRFNEKANPTPSKTTHNSLIEVIWTAVPVVILVWIFIPGGSYNLMVTNDRVEDADMTLKVTGNQWYWSYEYPDHGNFAFDANMSTEDELEDKSLRMLETDNHVVLPVGKKVRLLFTAENVIHSWGVPSLGIKLDAVPGRLNETWVEITEPGMYYGFCSELCGVNHSYMPIAIQAVSEDEFNAWVETAKEEFARVDEPAAESVIRVAQTTPVQ